MTNQYNNKNEDNIFKDLAKTNPLSVIVFYLIAYVFGTLLMSLIVCFVVSKSKGIGFQEAFQIEMNTIETKTDETNQIYYEIQAFTNLWSYILMFVIVAFSGRDYLKNDAKIFKSFKSFMLMILFGIGFALFNWGIAALGDFLVSKVSTSGTSQNEQLINNMVLNGFALPVGVSVILLAPLTEELVYRKSIMELTDKMKPVWQILLSALAFSIPHMLSSIGYSFLPFMILLIVYYLAGVALALIYYFFKKNIYASLIAHTLSNTFAFILMFI